MKIYAKTQKYTPRYTKQSELDKYIGKDIWVKVLYNESPIAEQGNYWWLRLLDKTDEGFLANGFYDFQINHPTGISLDESDLNFKGIFRFKNIKVPNPIDIMTTNEIFDSYLK